MRQSRAYRFGMITLALLLGSIVYVLSIYTFGKGMMWLESNTDSQFFHFYPLIKTLGSALWILFAMIAYTVPLRLFFGYPTKWKRVALLSFAMYLIQEFLGFLTRNAIMDIGPMLVLFALIWFFAGLFIVRDWVVRPDEQWKLNDLIKDFE